MIHNVQLFSVGSWRSVRDGNRADRVNVVAEATTPLMKEKNSTHGSAVELP